MSGLPEATVETVFAPVVSQTAFEETLDRLGTAIKLGLLAPGDRLPAERELCAMLGIARSTLRQALTALTQSGQLHAVRGRGGGTFVSDRPLLVDPLAPVADWRDVCAQRFTVEVGVAALAATRANAEALAGLDALVVAMDDRLDDYPAYRAADARFHLGLAEATGSPRVIAAMTEVQGLMTDLIARIAHPPEVLAHSNAQHARLLSAIRAGDPGHALGVMTEHLQGTEHVLAGLLPTTLDQVAIDT